MGNGVKVCVTSERFDATITLKKPEGLDEVLKNKDLADYMEKIMKEKLTSAMVEFTIMASLLANGNKEGALGFGRLVQEIHDMRTKAFDLFTGAVMGDKAK